MPDPTHTLTSPCGPCPRISGGSGKDKSARSMIQMLWRWRLRARKQHHSTSASSALDGIKITGKITAWGWHVG